MPLENRVDPFGRIQADPARGMFTGNRGVLHDPENRTLRRRGWTTKAWLVCALRWKGRRRAVMGRNAPGGGPGWTELFFLDEVTALSAGHRPCFHCRRERARAFAAAFARGMGAQAATAPEMDAVLHRQREASGGIGAAFSATGIDALPDGAVVALGEAAWAKRGLALLPWRFDGYGPATPIAACPPGPWRLVTPEATVNALAQGFRPAWHDSADQPPVSPLAALTGLDSGDPL